MANTRQPTIYLVENDLLPWLEFVYERELADGSVEPIDLTGLTIILEVRKPNGIRFSHSAVIDSAVGGEFHFEWVAGDLVEGISKAQVVITDGVSRPETIPARGPLILSVRAEV